MSPFTDIRTKSADSAVTVACEWMGEGTIIMHNRTVGRNPTNKSHPAGGTAVNEAEISKAVNRTQSESGGRRCLR